jgi:hypothetical protein
MCPHIHYRQVAAAVVVDRILLPVTGDRPPLLGVHQQQRPAGQLCFNVVSSVVVVWGKNAVRMLYV